MAYDCLACTRSYKCLSSLARHKREVHLPLEIKCRNCAAVFARRENWIRHEKVMHPKHTHTCSACQMNFVTRYSLEVHQLLVHPKVAKNECQERKCIVDGNKIIISQVSDAKMINNGNNVVCDICNESFVSQNILTQHQQTVHYLSSMSPGFDQERIPYEVTAHEQFIAIGKLRNTSPNKRRQMPIKSLPCAAVAENTLNDQSRKDTSDTGHLKINRSDIAEFGLYTSDNMHGCSGCHLLFCELEDALKHAYTCTSLPFQLKHAKDGYRGQVASGLQFPTERNVKETMDGRTSTMTLRNKDTIPLGCNDNEEASSVTKPEVNNHVVMYYDHVTNCVVSKDHSDTISLSDNANYNSQVPVVNSNMERGVTSFESCEDVWRHQFEENNGIRLLRLDKCILNAADTANENKAGTNLGTFDERVVDLDNKFDTGLTKNARKRKLKKICFDKTVVKVRRKKSKKNSSKGDGKNSVRFILPMPNFQLI